MPVSPILERQTTYPFVRLNEAARRVEAAGVRCSTSAWATRASRPSPSSARHSSPVCERMGYPAAVGLPELRRRSPVGRPPLRRGARPGDRGDPHSAARRRSHLRARDRRYGRHARHGRLHRSRLPGLRARRAVRARTPAAAAAARGARLPPRPRRDRRRDVAPAGGLLGQLPEQPDVRDRTALLLRAPGRAGARARVRRRLRRGVHRSSGSTSRPPRSSSSTAQTSSSSTPSPSGAR